MISFVAEKTCRGNVAEIIRLAAMSENGKPFSRFIVPEKYLIHINSQQISNNIFEWKKFLIEAELLWRLFSKQNVLNLW